MPAVAVVPLPVSIETGMAAPFRLTDETGIAGDPDAAASLAASISARTGLATSTVAAEAAGIELRITPGGPAESYVLIADSASVVIEAPDAAGLFYGAQTLAQLIAHDGGGWTIPAVRIEDAPRFAYRGVMLDVARHFQPVAKVKAYIDRAAGLKFNALHLHLTDDQGWRLELRSRPLLTERASGVSVGGDPGGFYTREDFADIVAHAASRHMIVVPELDMPGHTHAVGLAYPELVEEPVLSDHIRDVVRDFGGDLPETGRPYDGMAVGFSSLRIGAEATYDFVADVFGELASLSPAPFLHFGGDEALGTAPEAFAEFVARTSALIADLGKIPVAWHEAGAAAGLHDTTVGQYWGFVEPVDGTDETTRTFVRNGSRVILSPADAIYLDMKPTAEDELGLTWANGPTSVERAYAWEPSAVIEGIDEADVLGVEAPLWTETVRDLDDADHLAFPRIAAAAEAAWSPATGAAADRTWESFRERVGSLAPLWSGLGIRFDRSAEIPWSDRR